MGGGSSKPSSTQSNGVDIHTTSGANSVNTYNNITSGGGSTTQGATSTGSTTGVTANVTAPIPALMNLDADALTSMYKVNGVVCNQIELGGPLVSALYSHGYLNGTCAYHGY